MILHKHDMSFGISMKNLSSVKEQSQGMHSIFEPIRASLRLYTVTPYFDNEIEYMNFLNNPDDISLLYQIIDHRANKKEVLVRWIVKIKLSLCRLLTFGIRSIDRLITIPIDRRGHRGCIGAFAPPGHSRECWCTPWRSGIILSPSNSQ